MVNKLLKMGKFKRSLNYFDQDDLTKLVNEKNTCVELHNDVYHIALHPFHLNDINNSVKEILYEGVAQYNKHLDGILLGYRNMKLLSNSGGINDDAHFIHVDVEAEFFLFKPNVGKLLQGIANKKSSDHVGCLVHGLFNVSIPQPEEEENWIGNSVEIGQELLIRVIYTNYDSRLPYIRASLVSILSERDSGIGTSDEIKCQAIQDTEEQTRSKIAFSERRSSKKHKKMKIIEEIGTTEIITAADPIKIHKKKYKTINSNELETIETDTVDNPFKNHRKRYKKANNIEIEEIEADMVDISITNKKKKHKRLSSTEIESIKIDAVDESLKKHQKKRKPINSTETEPVDTDTIEDPIKNYKKKNRRISSNKTETIENDTVDISLKKHKKQKNINSSELNTTATDTDYHKQPSVKLLENILLNEFELHPADPTVHHEEENDDTFYFGSEVATSTKLDNFTFDLGGSMIKSKKGKSKGSIFKCNEGNLLPEKVNEVQENFIKKEAKTKKRKFSSLNLSSESFESGKSKKRRFENESIMLSPILKTTTLVNEDLKVKIPKKKKEKHSYDIEKLRNELLEKTSKSSILTETSLKVKTSKRKKEKNKAAKKKKEKNSDDFVKLRAELLEKTLLNLQESEKSVKSKSPKHERNSFTDGDSVTTTNKSKKKNNELDKIREKVLQQAMSNINNGEDSHKVKPKKGNIKQKPILSNQNKTENEGQLDELRKLALQEALLSISGKSKKGKKKHKSESKTKINSKDEEKKNIESIHKMPSNESLPDLNLSELVDSYVNSRKELRNVEMADCEDRKSTGHRNLSPKAIVWDDATLKLPIDSDLKSVLSKTASSKKKIRNSK